MILIFSTCITFAFISIPYEATENTHVQAPIFLNVQGIY